MLEIALLMLTMNEDGLVRVNLNPVESREAFADQMETVRSIFDGAGIDVLDLRCGATALRLTPFEHGHGPEAEVHRYRVTVKGSGGFDVLPLGPGAACTPSNDGPGRTLCAVSSQRPVARDGDGA